MPSSNIYKRSKIVSGYSKYELVQCFFSRNFSLQLSVSQVYVWLYQSSQSLRKLDLTKSVLFDCKD
jgi:hypothetical protein